jgi:hypothetical protein
LSAYPDDNQEYQAQELISDHKQLRALMIDQTNFLDAWFGSGLPHGCNSEASVSEPQLLVDVNLFADQERDGNQIGNRHFNETGYSLLAASVAKCLLDDQLRH